ncbi:hypothetical protein GLOIN_2v1496668 [Rhizophagus clarus]|uniref:Uncharacterized protein n=1 Tax=Rhizophagus clarus TaxID=94130 RepID=A0A8H3QB32_9GLOM|nr:hypothetical protein GLOIN_2v1496668 [Rhizophagus clarus]
MSQNLSFPSNLQITANDQNNLNTFYDYNNSLPMTSQLPFVNSLNSDSSASQYYSRISNSINDQQASNYFNLPNSTTFGPSQPQVSIPKSNQIMNLNNFNTQHHSYSPVMSSQLNQNQSYVNGISTSGSYANSNMNTMNMPFMTDNSPYQFQQQNSLGYNSFHGQL